jgi:hypothetical protein
MRHLALVSLCLAGLPCAASANELPDAMSVFEGTCSVLIVNGAAPAKPCVGSLVINRYPSGRRTVIFHDADDEAIAFETVPRQGVHFSISSVERNGESDPATGSCTIDLNGKNSGRIACEAQAAGHVTSGTFEVMALKHEIGGEQ